MRKAWDKEKVSGFIIVWETSFPYDNKRSAPRRENVPRHILFYDTEKKK